MNPIPGLFDTPILTPPPPLSPSGQRRRVTGPWPPPPPPPRRGGGDGGRPSLQVQCAQINMHRSHDSKKAVDSDPSLIQFIQELPLNKKKSHALSRRNYVVYAHGPRGGYGPRAALRISKSLVSSAFPRFISRDMASATVNIGDEEMVVVSVYCHRDDPAVSADLEEVALHCKNNRLPLIIGADSNSWSPLWGPLQNDRGKVFEEFINEFDLRVLNDSNSPHFYFYR